MIVDCFRFLNEFDLLDIRLNMLKDYVDKFVLCESDKTFSGDDKPLFFNERKDRYKEYNIEHLVYRGKSLEEIKKISKEKKILRRAGNRIGQSNCLMNSFSEDDIVLFGDVDEIPDLENIKIEPGLLFNMKCYYYYMNVKRMECWPGTIVLRGKDIKDGLFWERKNRKKKYVDVKGGWHFSYLGDKKQIEYKLQCIRLGTKAKLVNLLDIERCLVDNTDIFGRGNSFEIVDVSELPKFIQKNKDKYEKYFK